MPTSLHLTQSQYRTLLLAAQGLIPAPDRPATREDVLTCIQRMGVLQIDTINVVNRSPYLVLWSRIGAFDPGWLTDWLAAGRLFEYWAHAACFIPIEDFPTFWARIRQGVLDGNQAGRWLDQHADAAALVLNRVRDGGEVRAIEFERRDGDRGGWWNWKEEKIALEQLFNTGELMIARRHNFQRVYDLRERVLARSLPDWSEQDAPSMEQAHRTWTIKTLRALGAALPDWVADYYRIKKADALRAIRALEDDGALITLTVEGYTKTLIALAEQQPLIDAVMAGQITADRTVLLSPFDPVIWDRGRLKGMFGFDYQIECYTPEAKRRYGYFSLPILHRDALIGRLDAKAHRAQRQMEIRALHLEPNVTITDDLIDGLAGTLRDFAVWHGTPEILITRADPPYLADRVAEAV